MGNYAAEVRENPYYGSTVQSMRSRYMPQYAKGAEPQPDMDNHQRADAGQEDQSGVQPSYGSQNGRYYKTPPTETPSENQQEQRSAAGEKEEDDRDLLDYYTIDDGEEDEEEDS